MALKLDEAGESVEFLGLLDSEAPDPARKPRRLPIARIGFNLIRTPPKVLLTRMRQQLDATPLLRRARIDLSPAPSGFRLRLKAVRTDGYQR
jgi:thioesterase domain-containing protein